MDITGLLPIIEDLPDYRRLVEQLAGEDTRLLIRETAKPYLLAALYRRLSRPLLVIAPRADGAKRLAEQLAAWTGMTVRSVPEPDTLPYQRGSADVGGELELIEILSCLVESAALPSIIVASVQALTRLLPAAAVFRTARRSVHKGEHLDPLKLMAELVSWGYSLQAVTELPGQASRRGGIVDVFPPTGELPVRLEFFGNTLDSLRVFEPASQRSLGMVEAAVFGPAATVAPVFTGGAEFLGRAFTALDLSLLDVEEKGRYEEARARFMNGGLPDEAAFYAPLFNRGSLLDYLPESVLAVIDDPEGVRRELDFVDSEAERVYAARVGREVPPGFPRPYHTQGELNNGLASKRQLLLPAWEGDEEQGLRLGFEALPNYAGQFSRWTEQVGRLLRENKRVLVVSHQASRLAELLGREKLFPSVTGEVTALPARGSLTIVPGILAGGWSTEDACLFTDREIFGFLKQQRQLRRRRVPRRKFYGDLKPGDYVVHVEHGIGCFKGIIIREAEGLTREYMLLAYGEGARLYVPTDQIDRVTRYVGASDAPPTLSRLGSLEWINSKERARAAAEEIARDLLKLYAARELTPGFVYSPDNAWQMEMEASFPYVETYDQLAAIAQIKEDMAKSRLMDRLVTGDVGYGKTEVALRAAFKAVTNGKQVAVLVPTTVLAQQHFMTFRERLAAFPVKVEVLSRFRSHGEQQEVIASLADGRVDIIIGTHRLLQKDVIFKDLGLVIIDEEQRFGVSHKEYFKKLRQEVGVLALSATPIPRTLHMSLVGVRDMSVIETPPEERLPIKTYVAEYDERLVREAVVRELERGGQVFFVHNRVRSIEAVAEKLRTLVPEARLVVGHGQMDEDALEAVMFDFAQGRVDVLLCTTIIESGLDVPNANTLIVNQADRMGLTQLYQLRGRVGRGASLAYAYFLYDKGKRLTEDAGKRLRTIFEAAELGAGFDIAMKDLEIRGAGNILGVRQSGHINAVGFSYYTQLLGEAVEDLRTERAAALEGKVIPRRRRLNPPTIDLPMPSFIPSDYVTDGDVRLSLYRGLAGTRDLETAEGWAQDFKDRFGGVPPEVDGLLYAVKIKVLATRAGLASVSTEGEDVVLRRPPGMSFDLPQLRLPTYSGLKSAPFQVRLNTEVMGEKWRGILTEVLEKLGTAGGA